MVTKKKTNIKKTDWKGADEKSLGSALSEKREVLRKFRFSVSGSKVRDIKEARNTRKEIARILTELRSRQVKAKSA